MGANQSSTAQPSNETASNQPLKNISNGQCKYPKPGQKFVNKNANQRAPLPENIPLGNGINRAANVASASPSAPEAAQQQSSDSAASASATTEPVAKVKSGQNNTTSAPVVVKPIAKTGQNNSHSAPVAIEPVAKTGQNNVSSAPVAVEPSTNNSAQATVSESSIVPKPANKPAKVNNTPVETSVPEKVSNASGTMQEGTTTATQGGGFKKLNNEKMRQILKENNIKVTKDGKYLNKKQLKYQLKKLNKKLNSKKK